MKKICILVLILVCSNISGAEIKVGIGRKVITQQTPIWLTGYANRDKPAMEILQDLWAKALVFATSHPAGYLQRVVLKRIAA